MPNLEAVERYFLLKNELEVLEIDLTGLIFGELKILRKAPPFSGCGCPRWRCRCSCGNISDKSQHALLTGGHELSCGCFSQVKHNRTGHSVDA